MKLRFAAYGVSALLPVLGVSSMALRADEFMALPGLWKTTRQSASADAASSSEVVVQWHCVDEEADPWVDFAQLDKAPAASCTRTSFERTATSLKWKLDCSAPEPFVNEGSIVFDSPSHYTGTVKLSGSLMGYPLNNSIRIEGLRRAACTSPRD